MVAAAGFSSCSSDVFASYRNSGQDFILGKGLSPGNVDLGLANYENPGLWTWSWRGSSDASTFNYMDLISQGTVGTTATSGPSTLSASSEVYLLRLNNLIANGDFETALTGDWSADVGPPTASITAGPAGKIHGLDSLIMAMAANSSVRYRLQALADVPTSTSAHGYKWAMFLGSADFHYSLQDWGTAFLPGNVIVANQQVQAGAADFIILPGLLDSLSLYNTTSALTFGSNGPEGATIDDVRVLRKDITGYALRLLLRPTDTSPSLVIGQYEFSVWVKKSPLSAYITNTAGKNPYAAMKVTLSMNEIAPMPSVQIQQAFDVTPGGGTGNDASSGWTRLVLRMRSGINFIESVSGSFASRTVPVLELGISPTDSTSLLDIDSGEILIAQPELRFYLNGY